MSALDFDIRETDAESPDPLTNFRGLEGRGWSQAPQAAPSMVPELAGCLELCAHSCTAGRRLLCSFPGRGLVYATHMRAFRSIVVG